MAHDRSALFLSPYPRSAPSHRARIEQYLPHIASRGVRSIVRSLLDERAYHDRGSRRLVGAAFGTLRRVIDALTVSRFDVVLVHREALPLPTALVERLISKSARRLIFDFDDAIYLPQPFGTAPLARWLRSPAKFGAIVSAAELTIAGNAHLAERARRYTERVIVIPTTVDSDRIAPRPADTVGKTTIVIGWMGSPSTAHYLEGVVPALREILSTHTQARFVTVGADVPDGLGDSASARKWSLERETDDLRSFDIGIMPLPDDEWTRGKCGYKALQYMSAGVATVSSPVGVATEMIDDGRNGLLAASIPQWTIALSRLIEDEDLRRALGRSGRGIVEARYSVRTWAPRFYEALFG